MLNYDAKIILAFGEVVSGNVKIAQWLLKNGYPELCALHSCLRHDKVAMEWLLKNNYPHLAAFARAIDDVKEAEEWLIHNDHQILYTLKQAAYQNKDAIEWFRKHDLEIFILLAAKLRSMKIEQNFDYDDYHRMHF